jgi:hypothetical protein
MPNRNEAQGIITRTSTGIKGKAKVGEAGIERTQTAEANETAFAEQDITSLPHCQCGGLIKAVEDIGAVDCLSGEFLCVACSQVKCHRCNKCVGVESRINLGNIYCKRCAKMLGIVIAVITLLSLALLLLLVLC